MPSDLGQVEHDLRALRGRQVPLRALGGRPRAGAHRRLRGELARQLGQHDFGEPTVEVVAAEAGIAVGRQHLEDAAAELQDGDVEGAAAEVVDRDRALVGPVEPVRQRGRGRLVHETQHLEPREPPRVLGCLALAVVEVGGDGDDRLGDRVAERALGPPLELAQDVRRDLGRRHRAAADGEPDNPLASLREAIAAAVVVAHVLETEPHEPLDREDRLERMIRSELARARPDDHLAVGQEGHRRGEEVGARLGIDQHPRPTVLEDGDQAVGRTEINADYALHSPLPAPPRCRRAASAGTRSRKAAV